MVCHPCVGFPTHADKESSFYKGLKGTSPFRRSSIKAHAKSKAHTGPYKL